MRGKTKRVYQNDLIIIIFKEIPFDNGVKIVYSANAVGKIGQIHAKTKLDSPSYTIYKKELKMD